MTVAGTTDRPGVEHRARLRERRARRLGWAAIGVGGVAALAVQLLAPIRVPLYDGVVVQDPYRYLRPAAGQEGDPTSAEKSVAVAGSTSPAFAAYTGENPPQAQLNAIDDAFQLTPGATSMVITITPVAETADPPVGAVAGNVYRFSVNDQAGTALQPKPCEGCRSLALRAPEDTDSATVMRFADGAWQQVETVHSGLGLYQVNIDVAGDFAVIQGVVPDEGLDPLVLIGGAALLLLLFSAGGLFWYRRRPPPVAMAGAGPGRRRVASKRRSPRPPSGRSGS